jgi:hypothetical protein
LQIRSYILRQVALVSESYKANRTQWVVNNIASFGGDPNQITINGESAGAGSVRVLLRLPSFIGKPQGAIATSNLGDGVDFGIDRDYATTYSSYDTTTRTFASTGQNIFQTAGCNQAVINAQITYLKATLALKFVGLSAVARCVAQDGHFVNTEELNVVQHNPGTVNVHAIFGIVDNDGASFSTSPKMPVTTQIDGIKAALGILTSFARRIISSGLFLYHNGGNVTFDSFNVSQRIATSDMRIRQRSMLPLRVMRLPPHNSTKWTAWSIVRIPTTLAVHLSFPAFCAG